MTNITGTITNAGQMSPKDRNGNTYQDIDIQTNEGYVYKGRIGSKNGYQAGAPIQVTSEEKADGTLYFRKYNPQYPQDSQPPQQAPPQQAPQQQPQQQAPQGPTDKDILIVRQCCVKAAAAMCPPETGSSAQDTVAIAKVFEDYCLGRDQPASTAPATQPSGPNPDYDPNYQQPDDQIPF